MSVSEERRGQVLLIGIDRPEAGNRIDPPTYQALSRAYRRVEEDPDLRVGLLFGQGPHFCRGIDVQAFQASIAAGDAPPDHLDPFGKSQARRLKPLIAVVHGETWNIGHELMLAADIRIAAADTLFRQMEASQGRFPASGGTIRFPGEAGWGNAMERILTGESWTAQDAFRQGVVQQIGRDRAEAMAIGLAIAGKIAACAPLSVRTTLASAHMAIDPAQGPALAQLDGLYRGLYGTRDFHEGRDAEAQDRPPIYTGK